MAAIPPSSAICDPTDRSISPEIITNIIPMESIPVIDICLNRFDIFLKFIKFPPVIAINTPHITRSAKNKINILEFLAFFKLVARLISTSYNSRFHYHFLRNVFIYKLSFYFPFMHYYNSVTYAQNLRQL